MNIHDSRRMAISCENCQLVILQHSPQNVFFFKFHFIESLPCFSVVIKASCDKGQFWTYLHGTMISKGHLQCAPIVPELAHS